MRMIWVSLMIFRGRLVEMLLGMLWVNPKEKGVGKHLGILPERVWGKPKGRALAMLWERLQAKGWASEGRWVKVSVWGWEMAWVWGWELVRAWALVLKWV
jgi:hypothetical protein